MTYTHTVTEGVDCQLRGERFTVNWLNKNGGPLDGRAVLLPSGDVISVGVGVREGHDPAYLMAQVCNADFPSSAADTIEKVRARGTLVHSTIRKAACGWDALNVWYIPPEDLRTAYADMLACLKRAEMGGEA